MATKFDDYIREVEQRAQDGGPEAVARWKAFNDHFAMALEVRTLRKEHKLTQTQLAAASGIDQAEISRIERGQTNPTAATLAALLRPLGARLGAVSRDERSAAPAMEVRSALNSCTHATHGASRSRRRSSSSSSRNTA
jgi:DNA-binding XRE family transcriptional regulator